jgi:hypothetical protein
MDKFIEMTEDEWFETYKPVRNHIVRDASFDGYMFETYGGEVEFVKSTPEQHVWMYGDGDDGGTYIWSGWGYVNRIGYFVTEVPCPADILIQVKVDAPLYLCENCHKEWEDDNYEISEVYSDLQKCPSCATLEELKTLQDKDQNE